MRYRIEIEQESEGMFVAECPGLQGCVSHGFTRSEAIENIQEAIQRHVDDARTRAEEDTDL